MTANKKWFGLGNQFCYHNMSFLPFICYFIEAEWNTLIEHFFQYLYHKSVVFILGQYSSRTICLSVCPNSNMSRMISYFHLLVKTTFDCFLEIWLTVFFYFLLLYFVSPQTTLKMTCLGQMVASIISISTLMATTPTTIVISEQTLVEDKQRRLVTL